MARPVEYTDVGAAEGHGPWGGRWSREEDFSHLPPPAPRRGAPARQAPRGAPGEIRIEYDADSEPMGLQVGTKLRHPSFGVGEVRSWQGAGNDLKVTVRFPTVGVKTILARFLSKP
jgi:DNA helicase-2/ATP-dependent DNA helicase PcrA